MQRPPVRARGLPPAFASDEATLTLSPTRDAAGERVIVMRWHHGEDGAVWTDRMQLSTLDIERLRDFCDAWLAAVPPTEPEEAA